MGVSHAAGTSSNVAEVARPPLCLTWSVVGAVASSIPTQYSLPRSPEGDHECEECTWSMTKRVENDREALLSSGSWRGPVMVGAVTRSH